MIASEEQIRVLEGKMHETIQKEQKKVRGRKMKETSGFHESLKRNNIWIISEIEISAWEQHKEPKIHL